MPEQFQLWPAIDLWNNDIVRLKKGDFNNATQYDIDLPDLINQYNQFATGIHVVDLNGAKTGKSANSKLIKNIVQLSQIPIELGGGIRELIDISKLIDDGISRVVIGTKALQDKGFLQKAISKFNTQQIIVGVDIINNQIATNGWQQTNNQDIDTYLRHLIKIGIQTIIITFIEFDGMMTGSPISMFKNIVHKYPELNIIASGGVKDLKDLKELKKVGIKGVIFGKAYLEGKLNLEELIKFNNQC